MIRRYPIQALLACILLLGWFLLAFYNVLVDDDLVFLKLVHEHGILKATRYQYDTWNTRWMSFLWLHLWMRSWMPTSSLLPYHFFTLAALIGSSFRCVRALQKTNRIGAATTTDTLFMATLLTFAVVVGTYHIGDTWFWVNTSTMYGWNLILILWACSLLLWPSRSVILNSIALFFCGAYTGGSSEPAVVSLLVVCTALIVKANVSREQRNSMLIFLTAMCLTFLVAYLGQGHEKRQDALPDAGFVRWVGLSGWYFIKIAFIESPIRILIIFALLMPFHEKTERKGFPFNHTLRPTAKIWLISIAVHAGLIVAIMGDYGPPRALSFIGLISAGSVLWLLINSRTRLNHPIIIGVSVLSLAFVSYTVIQQGIHLPEYHDHVHRILDGSERFDPNRVPDSGLLHRLSNYD